MSKVDVLAKASDGATFLLNSPYGPDEVWDQMPTEVQRQIIDKNLEFYVIDATAVARDAGLGQRTNTVLQTCFFALSNLMPQEQSIEAIKYAIEKSYSKFGEVVVERNNAAVDGAVANLHQVDVPSEATSTKDMKRSVPADAPDFVQRVTAMMLEDRGDLLPVSAMPVDGTFLTGTTQFEKRSIAIDIPIFDPEICIECAKCSLVCPHAAIRMKVFEESALDGAPDTFKSRGFRSRELADHLMTIQVAPDDCTGCGVCVDVCPAKSKEQVKHKAINMEPKLDHLDAERGELGLLRDDSRSGARPLQGRERQGFTDARAVVRVLGCLLRLRRDPVCEARQPVGWGPTHGRKRHRLLVDLRGQPPDNAVEGQRRRSRTDLVELALRGQRRVRTRHADRPRYGGV